MACVGRSDFENVGEWEVTIERRHQSPFSHKSLGSLTVLPPPPFVAATMEEIPRSIHLWRAAKGGNRLENSASSMMGSVPVARHACQSPRRYVGRWSTPQPFIRRPPRMAAGSDPHPGCVGGKKGNQWKTNKNNAGCGIAGIGEGYESWLRGGNGSLAKFYQTAVRRDKCGSVYTTALTIQTDRFDLRAFWDGKEFFAGKKVSTFISNLFAFRGEIAKFIFGCVRIYEKHFPSPAPKKPGGKKWPLDGSLAAGKG